MGGIPGTGRPYFVYVNLWLVSEHQGLTSVISFRRVNNALAASLLEVEPGRMPSWLMISVERRLSFQLGATRLYWRLRRRGISSRIHVAINWLLWIYFKRRGVCGKSCGYLTKATPSWRLGTFSVLLNLYYHNFELAKFNFVVWFNLHNKLTLTIVQANLLVGNCPWCI